MLAENQLFVCCGYPSDTFQIMVMMARRLGADALYRLNPGRNESPEYTKLSCGVSVPRSVSSYKSMPGIKIPVEGENNQECFDVDHGHDRVRLNVYAEPVWAVTAARISFRTSVEGDGMPLRQV